MNSLQKVLLVDDDNDLRATVAEALTYFGFEVNQAGNVHDAMNILRGHPDGWYALITDFSMPDTNGGELIRVTKEIGLHFDVTVLISGLEKVDVEHALVDGGAFFLKKPFGLEQLFEILRGDAIHECRSIGRDSYAAC